MILISVTLVALGVLFMLTALTRRWPAPPPAPGGRGTRYDARGAEPVKCTSRG
jgi:hypothetical protein